VRPLVLIGAGGHAREVAELVEAVNAECPTHAVLGFLVEAGYGSPGASVDGLPILGDLDWLATRAAEVEVICAVGAPNLRRRLAVEAEGRGARFASVVHPRAVIGRRVEIGAGVVVQAGCVITTAVRLGDHSHLNVGATVSHDCTLESYVTLGPGAHAAGGVLLEEGCEIGVGAVIHPRRRVGAWSMVGAGSVVIGDVPGDAVVAGVPAKVLRTLRPGWHLS
jgi:sugar O-acyltransferase (sialic acid O-acetyltransferase NeuD family)